MSWKLVTEDWRLKLLALGLAILMLGAVAFSENPPTTGSINVSPLYSVAPNLVLINPPTKITVSYTGLADVIRGVNSSNMVVTVDATRAGTGSAVKLNVTARSLIQGVSPTQPAPIAVTVDTLAGIDLPVSVSAQAQAGWSIDTANTYAICNGASKSCTVHFEGPKSWEKGLQAYVAYPSPVNVGSIYSPGYQIQLKNDSGLVDLTAVLTQPAAGLDVSTASIQIIAKPGSTSSSVPLLTGGWSHPPPNGYQVTQITITPNPITISSQDPAKLGKVHSIQLPALDLSTKTSTATFQVAIPYPDGITGQVANATEIYQISPIPNVTPSPR